jgi:SOUL heme-binding protein
MSEPQPSKLPASSRIMSLRHRRPVHYAWLQLLLMLLGCSTVRYSLGFARTPLPPPAMAAKTSPTSRSRRILALAAASTSTEPEASTATTTSLIAAGNGADADTAAPPSPNNSTSPLSHESLQKRLKLLDDALREFNSTSAGELLQELADLRSSSASTGGGASTSTNLVDDVLDQLLARGPDQTRVSSSSSPSGLRSIALALYNIAVRRPVARLLPPRFSRRARMASLRRALDYSTPPPNEDAESESKDNDIVQQQQEDSSGDAQRRRRRALVTLLRTLARPVDSENDDGQDDSYRGGVAIRYLERKAVRESKPAGKRQADVDLTLRRPKGLETPQYKVVSVLSHKGTKVEIRSYEPYSVCTVSMVQPRPINASATDAPVNDPTTGGARAFGALAGYLFGKNRQQRAMAMTTPVISQPPRTIMQQQASGKMEDGKVMSFVLPSPYWTREGLASAPEPLEGSGVTLEYVEGGCRAVLMYGGYASQVETSKRKSMLRSALTRSEEWEAVPDEPIALAQYNDPFTPPWKRVNEVSVAVHPKTKERNP